MAGADGLIRANDILRGVSPHALGMHSLPAGVFDPRMNIYSGASAKDLLSKLATSSMNFETFKNLDLWIDPVNGSDSNDGLSASHPIRTCAFLRTLIPLRVKHNITVNFAAGDLDPLLIMGTLIDPTYRGLTPRVLFEGTTGLKSLTTGANTGMPSVALQDYIEKPVGAADWTVNEMVGELLFVVAGPGIGKKFLIRSNTGTRMYLAKSTGSPLNVLDTFEVRERKTMVNCSNYGSLGFGGLALFGVDGYDGGYNYGPFEMRNFDFYNPGFTTGIDIAASSSHIILERCRLRTGCGMSVAQSRYVDFRDTAFVQPDGSSIYNSMGRNGIVTYSYCLMKGGVRFAASDNQSVTFGRNWIDSRRGISISRGYGSFMMCDINNTTVEITAAPAFDTLMNTIHNCPANGLKLQDVAYIFLWMDNIYSNTLNGIRAVHSKIDVDSLLGSLNGQHGIQLEEGSFLKVAGANVLTGALGDLKPGALAAQAWAAGPTTDPTQLVRIHT